MNTIEKIVIGVVSALISSSLLFVETAAYKPEVLNSTPSFEQLSEHTAGQSPVAALKSPSNS